MKIFKLKINFKAIALVMAIGAAFAFNSQPMENTTTTIWFELNPFGDVIGEMQTPPTCTTGSQYCAVSVDSQYLDANGNPPFENVGDEEADQYIIETRLKN